jgi:hypothetical protein
MRFFLPRMLLSLATGLLSTNACAQSLPFDTISLNGMDAFKTPVSKSWHIVGNVSANRKEVGNLDETAGKGILIYRPDNGRAQPLISKATFGDLDIEMDVLLSKGASISLLFRERFEVKLEDSWMREASSVVKAPGLWQHLTVHFRAPKYDKNGKETKPGKLEKVELNGQDVVTSHQSTLPGKRSLTFETAPAPLIIRGGKLPFALKNIRYKTYQDSKILLSQSSFKVYNGLHKNPDTLATLTPKRTGVTDSISHLVGDRKSMLSIAGMMDIPKDGDYFFKLIAGGGAWVYIDGNRVIDNKGTRDFERPFYARQTLKKGKYPFKVVYSNSDECLVLEYEGPQIAWRSLTTPASIRVSEYFEPLEYLVKNKPEMQRGFMMHRGKVNPYTVAVGMPALPQASVNTANNYAYDLKRYNLLAGWHGRFIDVSNMWRERGEKQMEIPLGAKLEFSQKPLVAHLTSPAASWPDSAQTHDGTFEKRGYRLIDNGLPIYFYALGNTTIEDRISPTNQNEGLTREIKAKSGGDKNAYILLAEGSIIEQMPNGNYAVDNKHYYIENLDSGSLKPFIRNANALQQLLIAIPKQTEPITIKYNIIW